MNSNNNANTMNHASYKFEDPRVALKRHGFRPKYSWGQNFLISQKAVTTIAEGAIPKGMQPTRVVEIGAGVGTLTAALLSRNTRVVAVERDRDMCHVLRVDFGDHPAFDLREADAAKVDYEALLNNESGVIAGNLPYQLTGKLLRAIIDVCHLLDRAVVMVQEEVASRLSAPPGHQSRGALSAIIQSRFAVQTLIRLKPTAFHPPPKIRSAVLLLTPHQPPLFESKERFQAFDHLVNHAFTSRRKTLKNSLRAAKLTPPDTIEPWLETAMISPTIRPERLSQDDFIRLLNTAPYQA